MMTKGEHILRFFLCALCVFAVGFSVICPSVASEATLAALSLCAVRVVPSLFLFMAAAKMLSKCGGARLFSKFTRGAFEKLFGLSEGGGAVLFLGLLSGYPTGALVIAEFLQDKTMEKEEAERILPFVTAASPAFLIGAAGGMLGGTEEGLLLFFSQLASAFILLLVTRRKMSGIVRNSPKVRTATAISAVTSSIRECGGAILTVCSFVTFFYVFSAMTLYLLPEGTPDMLAAAISGFLEISCGFAHASTMPDSILRAFVCGAVTGFGGISVFMQSADALCACGVSMKKYFLGKITQALLCGCFCAVAKWFRVGVNAWVLFGEQEGKIRAIWEIFVNFTVFAAVICAVLPMILRILQNFSKK